MAVYLIRRFLAGLVVLMSASFLIYSILTLAPGGPLDQIRFNARADQVISDEDIARLKRLYKLDKPWPLNYLVWLFDPEDTTQYNQQFELVPKGIDVSLGPINIKGSGILTGDLGTSTLLYPGARVTDIMNSRIGNTLILMTTAQILSILIAFPIGIIAAIRQYSKLDYAVTTFSFLGLSMPSFWLGLMLIIFMAVIPKQLHDSGMTWIPYLPTGSITDLDRENDVINRIYHLILPVSVLSFLGVAGLSRFVRSSMLEVMRQDYVRTAWAKGLKQRSVILKHALRNALIPLITILALSLPDLVQGAIITESVFGYSGMGRLYIESVTRLDFPLAMGFLLIVTALVILSNILADVLYAVADPRIRFS